MKTHTIKIDKIDIESFDAKDIVVDPYWEDLYNPSKSKKTNKISHANSNTLSEKNLSRGINIRNKYCSN